MQACMQEHSLKKKKKEKMDIYKNLARRKFTEHC